MTQAVQTAQYGSSNVGLAFKNRIINGAMMIDQRNAGASTTPTAIGATYNLDRWAAIISAASKFSVQQSSTAPSGQGFVNSIIVTSLSAYSVAAADYFYLTQYVEGFNASDLMWGTANAKTVTLSFWVRSSLTGTFVAAIRSGGDDAAYPATYTINSANTWEQKTITIVGPTTGTFNTTNGKAFGIWFSLGAGSNFNGTANTWAGGGALSVSGATSVVGTNGATFYITGVQLEVGSTATSFDYRPYGTELALCQRYYEKSYAINTKPGTVTSAATTVGTFPAQYATYFNCTFQASKRTTPTMTAYSPSSGAAGFQSQNMATDVALAGWITNGVNQACVYTGGTANTSNYVHFTADAEL